MSLDQKDSSIHEFIQDVSPSRIHALRIAKEINEKFIEFEIVINGYKTNEIEDLSKYDAEPIRELSITGRYLDESKHDY